MKHFIANWKAHKNQEETVNWMRGFEENIGNRFRILELINGGKINIVVCPPYPSLKVLADFKSQHILIGSQDVSHYESGSFTGEVPISSIDDLCDYAIIGHSERRKYFNESEELIKTKLERCATKKIKTILCIRSSNDIIYESASMIAYEPVEAIGTGHNESADIVIQKKVQFKVGSVPFLYGGSVTPQNALEYLAHPEIDGLLIGSASLDPLSFLSIIDEFASHS